MEGDKCVRRTGNTFQRDWSQMKHNVLVRIFSAFHILDVVINLSRVCPAWYSACSDPSIWKAHQTTLDLSALGSYIFIPETAGGAGKSERSSRIYTRILRVAFDLSRGTITKLILHYRIYITDEHVNLVAQGCPMLKHLVLPRWHGLSSDALRRCLSALGSTLESLMIPEIYLPNVHLVKLIGENCPNLKGFKFMTELDEELADSIVAYLPGLKVLSIRGTTIRKNALELLMSEMQNLEVLNLMHSLLIHWLPFSVTATYICSDADSIINERFRRPATFLSCHKNKCPNCLFKYWYGECDELDLTWCEYDEDVWRVDEISSLSY